MASRRVESSFHGGDGGWTEFVNGLAMIPDFSNITPSPLALLRKINTLVCDHHKHEKEAELSRDWVQRKEREVEQYRGLHMKCSELEHENNQLKAAINTPRPCEQCKILRGQINTLDHEKAQYEIELSSRKEALLTLQNSLQQNAYLDYPNQAEDENLQLKNENSLLKEQLARCHQLAVEMQENYLRTDLSEELKRWQEKCRGFESECTSLRHTNDQLNVQLDTIRVEKERLQRRCAELETCQVLSPADESYRFNHQLQNCHNILQELLLGVKLHEGEKSDMACALTPRPRDDVSSSSLESRFNSLEDENQELTNKIKELNEALSKNDSVINILSGKMPTGVPNKSQSGYPYPFDIPKGIFNNEIMTDEFAMNDRTVVIKQKDERKTYGIYIDKKRGPITKAESKFFIASINNSSPEARALKVGDYVIQLNGINIQQASTGMVAHIIKSDGRNDLELVVRSPNREYNFKSISGMKPGEYDDWGVTFGVFIKEIHCSSFAKSQFGLHEFDEVLKVNNQPVKDLSINNIREKMKKFVRFEVQRIKEDLFIVPDGVYNSIHRAHLPSTDEYMVESEEALYVSKDFLSQSTPNMLASARPIQSDGRAFSCSTSTLLNNGRSFSPSRFSSAANLVTISIDQGYKLTFWKLTGGSSVGIFISEDTNGAEKGWKLLRINSFNLDKVALSFAYDVITFLKSESNVQVILEKIHVEHYQEIIKKVPLDSFHIKALVNHKRGTDLVFKMNDIFCVIDSHFVDNNEDVGEEGGSWTGGDRTVKWKATAAGPNGRACEVVIPKQLPRVLIIQQEPKYDWKKKQKRNPNIFYEILDDVDIRYSEMDDLSLQ